MSRGLHLSVPMVIYAHTLLGSTVSGCVAVRGVACLVHRARHCIGRSGFQTRPPVRAYALYDSSPCGSQDTGMGEVHDDTTLYDIQRFYALTSVCGPEVGKRNIFQTHYRRVRKNYE